MTQINQDTYFFINKQIMSEQASELKQRTKSFRKDLRRNHLEEIFEKCRNQILANNSYQEMIQNENSSSQLSTFHRELIQARNKQKYEDYISLKRLKYPVEWFYQFLGNNMEHQLVVKATNILGEYYYYTDRKIPSNEILSLILYWFQIGKDLILKNTIFIIHNLLHDYREIKQNLVQNFRLVEALVGKIELYLNQKEILCKLLKIVYHLLNLSPPKQKYHLFFDSMIKFITSAQTTGDSLQSRQINLTAIYNFHMLIRLFPLYQDLQQNIIDGKIIEKMILLLENSKYADRRFSYVIFDIIDFCKEKFKLSHIEDVIMPLVIGMKEVNFQYGPRSLTYTAQKIRLKAYNYLLYLAEYYSSILLQMLSFNNFQFMRVFLQELGETESPGAAEVLAKIFYRLSYYFSGNLMIEREYIKNQITRTIELNGYKYSLQKYFEGYLDSTEMIAQL